MQTEILDLSVQVAETFALLFGICEFGERVHMAFEDINVVFDQLKWYLMSIETRKMLLYILLIVQEPVKFKIFGSVFSNRKTFREVSSTGIKVQSKSVCIRLQFTSD